MYDWLCISALHKAQLTLCRRLTIWNETARKAHSWFICSVDEHPQTGSAQQKSHFWRKKRLCSDIWINHNVGNCCSAAFSMGERDKHVTTEKAHVTDVTSWGWWRWRWRWKPPSNRREWGQEWWRKKKRAVTAMMMITIMMIWKRQKTEVKMKTWAAWVCQAKKAIRRISKLEVSCCNNTSMRSSVICSATSSISSCSRAVVWSVDCSLMTTQTQKWKRSLYTHSTLADLTTSTASLQLSDRQCRKSSVTFTLIRVDAQIDWSDTLHTLSVTIFRMCVQDRNKGQSSAHITTLWCQCAESSFSEKSNASTHCWAWLDRPSPERRSTCSD